MRGTFVIRDGRLVPKHLAQQMARGPHSGLSCPMLIRDGMDALRGMHDGKFYESKSALRASYKAAGMIELGSDAPTTAPTPQRPKVTREEIAEAYQKVSEGCRPNVIQ